MTDHAAGVPILETPRLILRAHRAEDLDAVAAMWGDANVVRHITGTPSTREECWARILRYAGLWPLCGYGYWAAVEKASGAFIGDVGLGDFARDMDPPLYQAPEAGWALGTHAQGKGYATEAMLAVLAWADHALPGRRSMCLLSMENRASVRVAEKCGYRPYAKASYHGSATELYRR